MVRDLDKAFPYMNAALQGLDQFARLYVQKETRGKAIMKAVLALTIPSVLTYMWNHDDPNYKKLSNRIKDSFILIPKGDGTFLRSPNRRSLVLSFRIYRNVCFVSFRTMIRQPLGILPTVSVLHLPRPEYKGR